MADNTDTETYTGKAYTLLERAAVVAEAENAPVAATKFREARDAIALAVPAVNNSGEQTHSPPGAIESPARQTETYELQAHKFLLRAGHAAERADRIETAEILYDAALTTYRAMSSADHQAVADADRSYFINAGPTILSNDSPSPMRLDGIEWPTVQHYFQAEKLGVVRGPEAERLYESIRAAPTANEATRIGNAVPRVSDWKDREVGVMAEALCAKFRPGTDAAKALLETGDRPLVNNTPALVRGNPGFGRSTAKATTDFYWAQSHDHQGANALGRMLENCRDELRAGRLPTIDALTTKIPDRPFSIGDPASRRAGEYAEALTRHTLLRQSWTQSYRHPSGHAPDNRCARLAELGETIARAAKHFNANFDRYGPHLAEVRISRADLDTRARAVSVETSHTRSPTLEQAVSGIQV